MIFQSAKAVVTSDVADLPDGVCCAIVAAVAGNVSVITENNETVTLAITANAGQPIYLRILRVNATGTTATGIVAMYGPAFN